MVPALGLSYPRLPVVVGRPPGSARSVRSRVYLRSYVVATYGNHVRARLNPVLSTPYLRIHVCVSASIYAREIAIYE